MNTCMSKPKPSAPVTDKKDRGKVFNIRLGDDRDARLAEWIAAQTVEPDRTAVILKAIDFFLEHHKVSRKQS